MVLVDKRTSVLVVAGVVIGLAACADIFGFKDGVYDPDGSVDGAVDDVAYDYVVHDAFTIDVNTALCDGAVPLVSDELALWVSKRFPGNDVDGCGARTAPCASLNFALPAALARDAGVNTIYIDNSDFIESLDIDTAYAGFTIQGGWIVDDAGAWTQRCDTSLAKIFSPDDGGSPVTVNVHTMGAGITLRLLEIHSKANGAPGTGESVYAVMVESTDVLLDNVTLVAQAGGAGSIGSTGTAAVTCSTTAQGTGSDGVKGDAGSPGVFTGTGYTPTKGGTGTSGDQGTATPGQSGQCNLSCVISCTINN